MTNPNAPRGWLRLLIWLESLRADAVYGWRQLKKHKVTSGAAILSLALGIGACTSAFRLIDAFLLRPLPVAAPDRLYFLSRQGLDWNGKPGIDQECQYPLFLQMRAAVKDRAELLAFSYADRVDLSFGSDQEIEKAHLQYVSGWMFESFGLKPALGRLLTENDEGAPGAHPYAVLSYDYWSRRFGQDPYVVGRSFRMGETLFQIIGVAEKPFTGTEPGTFIDIFVPAMMNPYVTRSDASVFRVFAQLKPGVAVEPVRAKLQANARAFEEERAKEFVGVPKQSLENFLSQKLVMEPAPTGVSDLQNGNRRSLAALGVLVALVLLIACANVANLMTAQAAARSRNGPSYLHRSGALAPCATDVDRKRLDRVARGGHRRSFRVVVRALCGQQDQSARRSCEIDSPGGLARLGIRSGVNLRRNPAFRFASGATSLRYQAAQRAEKQRRTAL